jgi:GAF domain-containing protein
MTSIAEQNFRVSLEQKKMLRRITEDIRKTLELQDILIGTVADVRSFLATDRVMIYKFHGDGSGHVIAESIDDNRLPSLVGLNFPADDIPASAREVFIKSRVRSVVNVDTKEIGQSFLHDLETGEVILEDIRYRPVDECHVEYLKAMGVKSSLVAPILHQEELWGLLVSHHSEARSVSEYELEAVQMVVDHLSIAIAQSTLLNQVREKSQREVIVNRIANLLHSLPTIELQTALEAVIAAFGGSGGRLCIRDELYNINTGYSKSLTECLEEENGIKVYTAGKQPVMPDLARDKFVEQYSVWQEHYKSREYDVWAISDIYQTPEFRNLQLAFRPNKISSILMIPLVYRQQLLGYLSIFSDEIETEVLWAGGEFALDARQAYPRRSFDLWRSQKLQTREWKIEEIELAFELGKQFATALYEYELYQQVNAFNANLEDQVQERTAKLQQATEQQEALFRVVAKIRDSLDLDTIFQTATKEVCQLLQADRVAVYCFYPDWSGEFVAEFVCEGWVKLVGENIKTVWEDSYLQETQGGRYSDREYLAVDDIYQVGHTDCHIAILEQIEAKAYAIAPIFIGQKLWGLLAAYQNSGVRHWETSEIQFLNQIAAQFGVALQQGSLLTQTKQQAVDLQQAAAQQQLLFEFVAKMRESLDMDTIFQTTTKELRRVLNADRVGVYRFEPSSKYNDGEFIAEDVEPGFTSALSAKVHDHCFGEFYATKYSQGEFHVVTDVHNAGLTDCHLLILSIFQIQAQVVMPLMKGDELWGLLCIHQCSRPREWQASEIQFGIQIANQLGVALAQASLLAQTRQQATNLRQAAAQQQLLFEVVAKMRDSLNLDTIFQTTTKELRRVLNADRVGVYRFELASEFNDGEFIAENVQSGYVSACNVKVRDHCFGSDYATKYRHGRVNIISDIHNSGLTDCHVAILAQFQIRAQIVIPLMKGDVLWGLLCIHQCVEPRKWETSEIQFAIQIANQVSVALEQAELLAQTRRQTEQITKTLQDLKQTQAKLIQTEKMSSLGQLVAGIAHEINNPVNFIYGNVSHVSNYSEDLLKILTLYQAHYPQADPEIIELKEAIDLEFVIEDLPRTLCSMEIGVDRIRQIVLSLRNFSRLDEAEMKPVNIHEGIDSTLLILQHRIKAKPESPAIEVIKEYGDLPLVDCYAGQLNQVFMNVLSNGIDAVEEYRGTKAPNHHSQISIRTHISELNNNVKSVVIRIADNGPGIPEAAMSKIFDPFFTTKPVGKGTGLGLSISYQIVVEKHAGVFKVDSQPGNGTEFWIEIPLQPEIANS